MDVTLLIEYYAIAFALSQSIKNKDSKHVNFRFLLAWIHLDAVVFSCQNFVHSLS